MVPITTTVDMEDFGPALIWCWVQSTIQVGKLT